MWGALICFAQFTFQRPLRSRLPSSRALPTFTFIYENIRRKLNWPMEETCVWMVIRLWFIEHTWSPHVPCFSTSSTAVRRARPQTFCQAVTLGHSGWVTFSMDFLPCSIQTYRPLRRWVFLPYQIINNYVSGGHRANGSGVSANINSSTRNLPTEVPGKAHLTMKC